jgi:hypothetical protein
VDRKTLEKLGDESADRRAFLKRAGKAAATIPAVALLLSANATPAEAFGRYGRGCRSKGGHSPTGGRGPKLGHSPKGGRGPKLGHSHQRGRGHELGRGRGHPYD